MYLPGRDPAAAPCSSSVAQQGGKAIERIIAGDRFECVAAGLHGSLEETVVAWAQAAVRATGVRRVAVSAGLFMNVRANQRVLGAPEVETLFIMPLCGDESNACGAAYTACCARDFRLDGLRERWVALGPLYPGDDHDDRGVGGRGRCGEAAAWRRASDPEREVAQLIAAGNPVGRAAGRMECDARSLGNQSILADPSRPDIGA